VAEKAPGEMSIEKSPKPQMPPELAKYFEESK
jgi:hypothetical protein